MRNSLNFSENCCNCLFKVMKAVFNFDFKNYFPMNFFQTFYTNHSALL